MKKRAKRVERFHVRCPFCGDLVDIMTSLSWCSGCFVEWYRTRACNYIFDTERKTERFVWAKAVQKSGGMRIASANEDDE